MPFAKLDRMVADPLQQLSEGDLAGRHAHFGGRDDVLFAVREIDRIANPVVMRTHVARELQICRCELETVAGRISARQQGRARRRAGPMAGIGLYEIGTFKADGVDVWRRDRAARNTPAVEGDVVVAKVVSDDDDDVRLPSRLWRCGRPLLPHHVTRRSDLELDAADGNVCRRLGHR